MVQWLTAATSITNVGVSWKTLSHFLNAKPHLIVLYVFIYVFKMWCFQLENFFSNNVTATITTLVMFFTGSVIFKHSLMTQKSQKLSRKQFFHKLSRRVQTFSWGDKPVENCQQNKEVNIRTYNIYQYNNIWLRIKIIVDEASCIF